MIHSREYHFESTINDLTTNELRLQFRIVFEETIVCTREKEEKFVRHLLWIQLLRKQLRNYFFLLQFPSSKLISNTCVTMLDRCW